MFPCCFCASTSTLVHRSPGAYGYTSPMLALLLRRAKWHPTATLHTTCCLGSKILVRDCVVNTKCWYNENLFNRPWFKVTFLNSLIFCFVIFCLHCLFVIFDLICLPYINQLHFTEQKIGYFIHTQMLVLLNTAFIYLFMFYFLSCIFCCFYLLHWFLFSFFIALQ